MTAGRIRVAVIGTGFVGPHHVDAVRRDGHADVVALCGSDPARTHARAESLGVPRATTDLAELLADPGIDVVHVCTPNDTHVAIARAAMEAGKHVVVEKPLALTSADADALVELAARTGRLGLVAFTYRGYPIIRGARDLIRSGEMGDVRLVHGTYLQDWLLESTDYNWRVEPGAGGPSRAVADIGSHWFDTAEFVSGRRVEAVLADLATFMPTRQRPRGAAATFPDADAELDPVPVASEDAATFLVRFQGGARGVALVSQVSAGHKNDFRLEIAAAAGSLAWQQEDPNHLWLGSRDDGGSTIRPREPGSRRVRGVPALPAGHPEGWSEALRDLFRPFYAAVADGAADADGSFPTLADGARAVRFVEAVLRSAASGTWESLT